MALVLHDHPRSSNAQKVRFLLAELELPYERRDVPLGRTRPDWHVAVNPAGGIPALIDDGFALAESHAILRYLATDDVYPAESRARARIDWVLELIAGPLREANHRVSGPAFGWRPREGIGAAPADPAALAEAVPQVGPLLAPLEAVLGPEPWACGGRFSLADCAAAPVLWRLRHAGALAGRIAVWADAVHARPAWSGVGAEAGLS